MKNAKTSFFISNIVYVLLLGLIIRLLLSFFGTLHLDQGTFIAWATQLSQNGFKNFYNGWSDYLPGYLYILSFLGKVNLVGMIPEVLLFKLPAIFADILAGFLIYKILTKYKSKNWGLVGAAVYIFNPAIIANSTLWGQVDSLTALSVLASLYFLDNYYLISALTLSVGTLIKPQAAFILPIILFFAIKNKWKAAKIFMYVVTGLLIFILGFVPFSNGKIISFIIERLILSANQYPYTSVNAFNFWGLFGLWRPDNIFFQYGGYIFVFVITTVLLIKSSRSKLWQYANTAFILAASFIFFTRMHERHLLPTLVPLAVIAIENPIFLIPYVGFSLIYIANLAYSYNWITFSFTQIFPDILIKFFEVSSVLMLVFMFMVIWRNLVSNWKSVALSFKRFMMRIKTKNQKEIEDLPKLKLSSKKSKTILYLILLFAFVSRIFNLWNPPTMYFDEVYHAFTAKVMMSNEAYKAWEWWNTPPSGFAYEWTHPPLAKLGMVLGMSIFGQNSFGWRVPGALLGVGAVFLVYLLAKNIFKDEVIGLISAGVFSLDGLPLVLSRIGMNDSYLLFFALLSIYMFLKKKNFFSALAFGLALASKWSALWTIPILLVLWIRREKRFTLSILWFLVLPIAIYLLSYTQMFTTGHTLETWWGMQKQMWWYHTGLRATHPYSSPWWSWPFLIRPVYLYTTDEIGGMVARIYTMGNPFVFWFGITSIVLSAFYAFIEKNKNLGLIVFSYLIFFVPWAISPRIMFFYHYLPSIPFMCIAIGYILRRNPKLIKWVIPIFVMTFIYFFPHFIGLKIPIWLDSSYYWIASWR